MAGLYDVDEILCRLSARYIISIGMSKTRKKRDNQVYIKDIEEWKAAVAKPILLVAEIFAPHFGPCEIMFPFIDELMTNLDNQGQADEVHWAIVNVAKLEDEKAAADAEDALKKQETKGRDVDRLFRAPDHLTVGEKPKEEGDAGADNENAGTGSAAKEPEEPDTEGESSEQLDMTIPYLEKYAGFNHPTPHYVFFRNGVVIEELRGANPPKLEQLVRKWIAIKDIPLKADDASTAEPRPKTAEKVPAVQNPDLKAIPPEERPRRGSMSLYAPDDDLEGAVMRDPSPESRPAPSDSVPAPPSGDASGTPTSSDKPASSDMPASSDKPASSDTPTASDKPASSDTLVSNSAPARVDTKAAAETAPAAEINAPVETKSSGVAPSSEVPGVIANRGGSSPD